MALQQLSLRVVLGQIRYVPGRSPYRSALRAITAPDRIPSLSWAARTFASGPGTTTTTTTTSGSASKQPVAPKLRRARLPKDPHLMSQRVLKLARQDKLDEAIELVKESPYSLQSEVVWNHLIDETGRLGRTNQALKLLSDMKKRGFEPTERTYTILFKALAKNPASPETVARAKELYADMATRDITPNLLHTNALLKVCGRAGDLDSMHDIFTKMPRHGPHAPDTITFNTVLGAYGQYRDDGTSTSTSSTGSSGLQLADQAWEVWDACLAAKIQRPDMIDIDERLLASLLVAVRHSARRAKDGLQVVQSLYGLQPHPAQDKHASTNTKAGRIDRTRSPAEALGLGPVLAAHMPSFRTISLVLQLSTTVVREPSVRGEGIGQRFIAWVRKTFPNDFVPDMPLLTQLAGAYTQNRQYHETIGYCLPLYHQHRFPQPSVVFFQHVMAALYGARDKTPRAGEVVREVMALAQQEHGGLVRKDGRPMRAMDPLTLGTYCKHCTRMAWWQEGLEVLDLVRWQEVVARSDHHKANYDIAHGAVRIFREALKELKKELRRDDYHREARLGLKQQQESLEKKDNQGGAEAGLEPKLLSVAARKKLQAQIEQREGELQQAVQLEHHWAKERVEKARETKATYRERVQSGAAKRR